jgi:TRAP-type C4-dicarboxylate transport system permease small subunit
VWKLFFAFFSRYILNLAGFSSEELVVFIFPDGAMENVTKDL